MSDDVPSPRTGLGAVLDDAVERLGRDERIDPVADALARAADALGRSPIGPLLQGRWLGHTVHPLMTDIPIGCWTCAAMLDVAGGRAARPASRRLIAWGTLSALPTIATGLAELATIDQHDADLDRGADPRGNLESRRIATVHAGLNLAAVVAYASSWNHRRRDHHLRGLGTSLVGAVVASVAGHLGGHLAFVHGVGHGARSVRQGAEPEGGSIRLP